MLGQPTPRDYPAAIHWILRERGGGGGHPPDNVNKVAGWKATQLVAHIYNKSVRAVAADLVDAWQHEEER